MSQGRTKKRKFSIYGTNDEEHKIVRAAIDKNEGYWVNWTKKGDVADLMEKYGVVYESFFYNETETCFLRCRIVEGKVCSFCKSEPFPTFKFDTRYYKKVVIKHVQSHQVTQEMAELTRALETLSDKTSESREERIGRRILEVCKQTGCSMSLFEKESFRELILEALKGVSGRHKIADEICMSRQKIAKIAESSGEAFREKMKDLLPKKAKRGELGICLDHKYVHGHHNTKLKILGIEIWINNEGTTEHYLLDYTPCVSTAADYNVPIIKKILAEYNILEDVEMNRIPFCSDHAAIGICAELTSNYSCCGSHNFSNIMKRTLLFNLAPQDRGGYDKMNVVTSFIDECGLYKKSQKLPGTAAYPSLNAYFRSSEIKDEENIRRFQSSVESSTWYAKRPSKEDRERFVDEKVVSANKKGKTIERTKGSTRFRKHQYSVDRLLLNETLIRDLYSGHPQEHLIEEMVMPDFNFAQDISMVLARLGKSINLMETANLFDGVSFYTEMENLMVWAVKKLTSHRNERNRVLKSLLISILEQITSKRLNQSGIEMPSTGGKPVPCRFSPKDKACIFLTPGQSHCDFGLAKETMRKSKVDFVKKFLLVLETHVESWSNEAVGWITGYGPDILSDEEFNEAETGYCSENDQSAAKVDSRYLGKKGIATSTLSPIEEELMNYNGLNSDDLQSHHKYCIENNIPDHERNKEFWKNQHQNLPKLSALALMLLRAPVSSSSLERQFSWTTLVYSMLRKSLSTNRITQLNQNTAIL